MLLNFWKKKRVNENSTTTEENLTTNTEKSILENYINDNNELDFSICNNYIDSKCQIMSQENVLFFNGIINEYIEKDKQLKISDNTNDILPAGVTYNTNLKINIKTNSNILIIYAILKQQTNTFWIVELDKIIKIQENRSCFRQTLRCRGIITYTEELKETKIPCDLIDISLTGISFRSTINFDIDEKLTIDNVVLFKDSATIYKFDCIIKREFKDENNNTCYGCMFEKMPKEVEDKLCTDIFQLQLLSNRN